MAPKATNKRAKATKLARVVASRIKAANMKISKSNTRAEPEPASKKKGNTAGRKRKAADSNVNEASCSKRPSRKASSQPLDDQEEDAALHAEIMQNLTGGLKLLKRETVTMGWLTSSIIRGKKIHIQYSKNGDPTGKEYGWLQSYIGVLARTRVPISYHTWKHVPEDEKEKIWECIMKIFVYPRRKRKEVVSSAGIKWRNFKSMLTSKYIMPYKDDLEALENVPDDYRFINKDTWQEFVAERLSAAHLEVRQKQILRRKKNKYNHRLSRKGYRGIRVELSASMSTEDMESVSRHAFWIKARQDKQGKYKDAEVEEAVKKILDLEKQAAEGIFKPQGTHDVLTEALGNPEHRGRTRGIGAVKPEEFFKLPVGKRGRKKKDVELDELLAKERAKWEEEMNKKHDEDMRRMAERYEEQLKQSEDKLGERFSQMLESRLQSGNSSRISPPNDNSPTPNSPILVVNAKSGEGSCNRQGDGSVILGKYEAIKKKLDLDSEHVKSTEEGNISGQIDVTLCLENVDNVVAYGKALQSAVELDKQTIHGRKLGIDQIRVEILVPVVGDAKLPFPIKDEIYLVKDALGSIVAWPRNLCVMSRAHDKVAVDQVGDVIEIEDTCTPTSQKQPIREADLVNLPANLPEPLLNLCKLGNEGLSNGKTIKCTFVPELFGHQCTTVLLRTDLYAIAHLEDITASIIMCYMSHLFNVLKKEKLDGSILFVDPTYTYALGTQKTPTDRSSDLMERFKMGKDGSIFLIPYNSGGHWTLSVVDVENKKAFYLDSLRRRLPTTTEWTDVVNNAVKFFHAQKAPKKKLKISVKWMPLRGIPKQWDDKTCGYFVMRFMREIVFGKGLPSLDKWRDKSGLVYTQEDLDEVRKEWAEVVLCQ